MNTRSYRSHNRSSTHPQAASSGNAFASCHDDPNIRTMQYQNRCRADACIAHPDTVIDRLTGFIFKLRPPLGLQIPIAS